MNWAQATNPFPAVLDALGLNYQGVGIRGAPGKYPSFHEKFPDKLVFASESASALLRSRGDYVFPCRAGPDTAPPSAADPARIARNRRGQRLRTLLRRLQRFSPDKHLRLAGPTSLRRRRVRLGPVGTTLANPPPSTPRAVSYSGIIDLAGFKKDRFYLYQAHWRPDYPMAHILPHWTWPERTNQITPVHVFTSGDEAELFLNGKSLGRKKKGQYDYRLRWDDVVYEPGTLKVVTYKNGKQWATDVMQTARQTRPPQADPRSRHHRRRRQRPSPFLSPSR